jgi:phosphoserine aminotransferase
MCIARNVLRWLSDLGGLAAMGERNRAKAAVLYGALDKASGFYNAPVEPSSRSRMNVVFRLPTEDLEARFVKEADAAGLFGLKGHRSVGGIRASIYNAVEPESVNALAAFVADFAARNG